MTKEEARHYLAFALVEQEARLIRQQNFVLAEAYPRFVVRDHQQQFLTDTDDIAYARVVAFNTGGDILDRHNWR